MSDTPDPTTIPTSIPTSIPTRVSLESLPSPPFVAMQIIRLTGDHDSSTADLAEVLSRDPVLSARILQVANSPAYGLASEVSSVERASALLGLKAVRMMALSFSLAGDMGDDSGTLSMDAYWYHSLLNAVAGRRWAELVQPPLAEEAFLAGLLSHLGRLVLARERPAEFAEVLARAGSCWPGFDHERAVLGFTSAEVTDAVLRHWGLPPLIVEAVTTIYTRRPPDPEVKGAAELGSVMSKAMLTAAALDPGADSLAVDRLRRAVRSVGIVQVDQFVGELEGRVREVAELLDVALPEGVSHQQMLDEARAKLVAVSLETVQSLESAELQTEELRASNEQLEGLAFEDRLTRVANRAAFDDHLARAVARAVRRGHGSIGLLLLDIDHFKAFNDAYGHQLGDEVLRRVARAMKAVSRADELFARYGGEEFALVAVDCVPSDLEITGERLRRAVAEVRIPSSTGDLSVTVSGGAAVLDTVGDRDAGARLIKLADEALYDAKAAGRNRICVAH